MKKLHRFLWNIYEINWGKWGYVVGETKRVGFHVVHGKFRFWK